MLSQTQSKDTIVMKLELLPNEIFLDLFDYFSGVDLLQTFYDLNSRFNFLLYNQFRFYRFRFYWISKYIFDQTCQQHLPFITDRITSLQLSNSKETSKQINLFFSYFPSFRQFIHLRALTISNLHSYDLLLRFTNECQYLSNLTHLGFHTCSSIYIANDFQVIIDNIWRLPKLTSCHIDIDIKQSVFCFPTIISVSLQSISILRQEFQLDQINQLFQYTPHLKHLFIFAGIWTDDNSILSSFPTLIKLHVCFISSYEIPKMILFFKSMPNLRHLSVSLWSGLIQGHQWGKIIRDHLTKLKTFRIKMEASFHDGEDIQQIANELIDSFRTPFWTIKHRWFVQCITSRITVRLDTVSSESTYYEAIIPDSWQSTCSHDNQQEFYDNMTSVYSTFFDQLIPLNIRLSNINYLHIKLPIKDQLWWIIPNFDRLKSLTISSHADTFQSEVQTLLDRASHLITLTIHQNKSIPLQMSLCNYTNTSVSRIDLRGCIHYFNVQECLILASSPLLVQCEVLFIRVNDRESIIHLINNIHVLRALIVRCQDDEHNDELVQWLHSHLPSTCSIVRDSEDDSNISIWK